MTGKRNHHRDPRVRRSNGMSWHRPRDGAFIAFHVDAEALRWLAAEVRR